MSCGGRLVRLVALGDRRAPLGHRSSTPAVPDVRGSRSGGQSTSSTSFPRTRPASPTRCASATSVSGNVCPTGARSARTRPGRRAGRARRARAGVAAAEPHAVLLRTSEVGDGDHLLGPPASSMSSRQDTAAGDVERQVDAVGSERADPLRHAVTVGDGFGAERAQQLVGGGAAGTDHARAPGHGELDGGAADASGGAVDEHRAAALTPSWSSARAAVSTAAGSAAAAAKPSDGGMGA